MNTLKITHEEYDRILEHRAQLSRFTPNGIDYSAYAQWLIEEYHLQRGEEYQIEIYLPVQDVGPHEITNRIMLYCTEGF